MSSPRDLRQEREWIVGLQAGRVGDFRAIFERFAPQLKHFACIWVEPDAAEDIVQDVLFDLWKRRESLQIQTMSLNAYLFTAVRNRAATHLRHQTVITKTEEDPRNSVLAIAGEHPVSPDDYAIERDLRDAVHEAISSLSELQRAVLLLRWTQEMTLAEVAATLAISENAAKLAMARARQNLSRLLRSYL